MDEPEFQRWLTQAREDFDYACDGMRSHFRGAVWNFNQASEKVLKAFLLFHQRDFPRTHDLPRLLTLVAEVDSSADEIKECAFILYGFLPVSRYPGDFPALVSNEVEECRRAAVLIFEWVESRMA